MNQEMAKLYNLPQLLNNIDINKLLISNFGFSNVSSPLIISDTYGNPILIEKEKILSYAKEIKANIISYISKKYSFTDVMNIFDDRGPGFLFRTNFRIIYIRKVQIKHHIGPMFIAGGKILAWQEKGLNQAFSVPLSKIESIYSRRKRGPILIYLNDQLEKREYMVKLFPFHLIRHLVNDLLNKSYDY